MRSDLRASKTTRRRRWETAAIAMLFATLALLSLRTLTSIDLGFNLDYGRTFLATGRIVDSIDYLYTLPPSEHPPSGRPEPGPGSRYDESGRYRFVNANWLSQVLSAATWSAGGTTGLVMLRAALCLLIYGCLFVATRRLGLEPLTAAVVLLLFALVANGRFMLRPELFGFACLAAQLAILAPAVADPRSAADFGWRRTTALAALQILFVNLHSYFLLPIGAAGAILVETGCRWLVARPATELARATARMGRLLLVLAVACFVNPWTWRLAVLPLETLAYLRRYDITGGDGSHPWSHIAELHGPFDGAFPGGPGDYAMLGLLAFATVGALAAAASKRVAPLLMIIGMASCSFTMVRNVAPAGIVLFPVTAASLRWALVPLLPSIRGAALAGAVGLAALSPIWAASIVSNRYYLLVGAPTRFGVGISRAVLPLGAAAWLSEHPPGGRIWCDTDSSSTLRFFTRPSPELPILSNQWAYPPELMDRNQKLRAAILPFEGVVHTYGITAVVLHVPTSVPLFESLAADGQRWALVHAEGEYALFFRAGGDRPETALAGDVPSWVARARAVDRDPRLSLVPVGHMLLSAGALDLAIGVLEAAVLEMPDDARLWSTLGSSYASRGDARRDEGGSASTEDYLAAQSHFRRALALRPDYEFAQRALRHVEQRLTDAGGLRGD